MDGRVVQVTLGGTFRATWVNSGQSPSPIVYNILSGSETMVSSYAGVSSGNGHFYAEVTVNSPGVWKGSWIATIAGNPYRNDEWIAAFPYDTDQPGRYITWDDVVHRFVGFSDVAGAVKAASHYLAYAEADVDARLGATFTIPFSNNNMTVRDLVIDMVYLRAIRGKSAEYDPLKKDIDERIAALNSGTMVMVTAAGAEALPQLGTPAWSNTQDYHPIFAVTLDHEDMVPSSLQMQAEADERGF